MYYDEDRIYYIEDFCWRLDVPYWEITKEQKELLLAADMLQDARLSLRGTSRETGFSRSTLHRFIHCELSSICYELYQLCIRQLKWNKENNNHFVRWPRVYRRKRY